MKVASWKKRRIETIAQHSAQQQNDDNDDGADGSDGGKWEKANSSAPNRNPRSRTRMIELGLHVLN